MRHHSMLLLSLSCLLLVVGISAAVSNGSSPSAPVSPPLDGLLVPQTGSKLADRIVQLPGQPQHGKVVQYGGYVTVDAQAGRALFYYFVQALGESPPNHKPLILWLNGGPGCSSLGVGAMLEHGPLRVNGDAKTLRRDKFSWNKVANVLYLDSPVGVGLSYSNSSSDYNSSNEEQFAMDNYKFLVNWLERFPEYKNRDVYLAGENNAAIYLPQLAEKIFLHNKQAKTAIIRLKGLVLGNPTLDESVDEIGYAHYLAGHGYIPYRTLKSYMTCINSTSSTSKCSTLLEAQKSNLRALYIYDVTARVCKLGRIPNFSKSSNATVNPLYECDARQVESYINQPEVKKALHANAVVASKPWTNCNSNVKMPNSSLSSNALPALQSVLSNGVQVLVYSGDADVAVPVTSTRYALRKLNLTVNATWHPWFVNKLELGGYTETYQGGLFRYASVKGGGHLASKSQGSKGLGLIQGFLDGTLDKRDLEIA